jgi:hypothetical protein
MSSTERLDAGQHPRISPGVVFFIFAGCVAAILLLHLPYLHLPYFWDEMAQFIPAAADLAQGCALVPHSAIPNVHPPGVMAYLALVWSLAGSSILVTRQAMLFLAGCGLFFAFLLSVELCRPLPLARAVMAPALLLISPLFFTQAMLAQLDMPAMVLSELALLLFLRGRYPAAAFASTLLVLAKETGIVAPGVFLSWLVIRERKWREACYFLAPFLTLAAWLVVLKTYSGNWVGNQEFGNYNLLYPLNPARAGNAFLRRFYYIFMAEFRWIGTLLIVYAWRKSRLFARPQWVLVGLFAAGHVILISLLGGAALERYVLPVLPLFYVMVAAAMPELRPVVRRPAVLLLACGLLASMYFSFLPSPLVYPLENNLAMVDFIRLQQQAAEFLNARMDHRTITTAWPLTQELSDPYFGYVRRPMRTVEIVDFHAARIAAISPDDTDVLVVYARPWWDLPPIVLKFGLLMEIQRKYFGYAPEVTADELRQRLGYVSAARWERGRQWIEVYVRPVARHTGK